MQFKEVSAYIGKDCQWMALRYLQAFRNDQYEDMELLLCHAGYQAFKVNDESWEPLYYAFEKRDIPQINAIAIDTPLSPQDTSQNMKENTPSQEQINDHDRNTSDELAHIPWNKLSPLILRKTNFTAKLGFPVYAVGYKDKKNDDKWSKRFMGFKNNNPKDVIGGTKSLCLVAKIVIEANNLIGNTGVMTALPHDAVTSDSTSPLYKSANAISNRWNVKFLSTSLTKKEHPSLRKLGYLQRKDIIRGCYSCSRLDNIQNIIILDDFVTSGLTFQEIERAIRANNNNVNIFGIVLAIHPPKFTSDMNDKVFAAFEILWTNQK